MAVSQGIGFCFILLLSFRDVGDPSLAGLMQVSISVIPAKRSAVPESHLFGHVPESGRSRSRKVSAIPLFYLSQSRRARRVFRFFGCAVRALACCFIVLLSFRDAGGSSLVGPDADISICHSGQAERRAGISSFRARARVRDIPEQEGIGNTSFLSLAEPQSPQSFSVFGCAVMVLACCIVLLLSFRCVGGSSLVGPDADISICHSGQA